MVKLPHETIDRIQERNTRLRLYEQKKIEKNYHSKSRSLRLVLVYRRGERKNSYWQLDDFSYTLCRLSSNTVLSTILKHLVIVGTLARERFDISITKFVIQPGPDIPFDRIFSVEPRRVTPVLVTDKIMVFSELLCESILGAIRFLRVPVEAFAVTARGTSPCRMNLYLTVSIEPSAYPKKYKALSSGCNGRQAEGPRGCVAQSLELYREDGNEACLSRPRDFLFVIIHARAPTLAKPYVSLLTWLVDADQ